MPKRKTNRSRWGSVILRGRSYYVKFHWPAGRPPIVRAVGPSEDEAEKMLLAVEAALKNGVPLADVMAQFFREQSSSTTSFAEAKDLYLESARSRKRAGTLRSDEPRLAILCKADWARLPLSAITSADIERWLLAIRKERSMGGPTANRYLAAASCVFKWAAKNGHCERGFNPVREIEKFPESSGREVFLTPAELEAWIAAAPEGFRVMARFYARTGVRRDEARLLRWRSLDLDRGVVRVEAEVAKNRTSREVELTPDLREALRDHRSRAALRAGHLPGGDEYVFEIDGIPWSTYRVRDVFRATVKAARDTITESKRKALRLHDIRHTVGAILASHGVSLEIIAKVLGHKSLVTTRRYAHLYPSVISQAAKVLSAAIPVPQPERVSERAG